MKIRCGRPLLIGLCVVLGGWVLVAGQDWAVNLAYLDLSRAVIKSDAEAASRFEERGRSNLERDASTYGMAMLAARRDGESPEHWLREWTRSETSLRSAGTVREQMILCSLGGALAPRDLMALANNVEPPAAAGLLLAAAVRQPEESEMLVRAIEDRGLVSALSSDDRARLAAVYGDLANLKRLLRAPTEEVMALADRSLELDPRNEMAMVVKGLTLYHQQQLRAGLTLLEQVIDLYPESVFAWQSLAYLRLGALDFRGAEGASRQAISVSPPGGPVDWAQNLLATALLKQGRCDEALSYALPPTLVGPNVPDYLLALADAYWCMGDRERASSVYKQLEAIAPDLGHTCESESPLADEYWPWR